MSPSLAPKTLAATAIDLFSDPELTEQVTVEFDKRRGEDFVYMSLVGHRLPQLDYSR